MAQVAKTVRPETAETPIPVKRSGKLLLIILLIVVLLFILVIGGVAALLLIKKNTAGNGAASHEPLAAPAMPPASVFAMDLSKPPVFVQLEPFTTNLRTGEGEDSHYLQMNIALRVSDQKTAEALKSWMPEIRNRVNLILASKSLQDMHNDTSHEKLQNEILRGLNTLFGAPAPLPGNLQISQGPILGVLFISIIVQ